MVQTVIRINFAMMRMPDKVNSDEVGREGGLSRDAIAIMTDSQEEEV